MSGAESPDGFVPAAGPHGTVWVRGGATAEELAVLITALDQAAGRSTAAPAQAGESGYERWRRGRIAVLRATSDVPESAPTFHEWAS